MAINAKLVDTKPTIDEFKKLTECLDGVKNAFKGLDEAIPKSFADTISSYSKSVVTLTNTLDKMGQGFKNISNYADKAVTTLNNLTRSTDGRSSRFNIVLIQLEESLRGVDTAHIERVSTSLRRLGESLANLSRHGHNGVATLKDLAGGFNVTSRFEDTISSETYEPVAKYVESLSASFDNSFGDFDISNSGITKASSVLASFSKSIAMFNKDAEQVVDKLHNKQLMSNLKEGITSFIEEFKHVSVELSSMKEVGFYKSDNNSLTMVTKSLNIDDILTLMKRVASSGKQLHSYVNSPEFVDFAYKIGPEVREAFNSFGSELNKISLVLTSTTSSGTTSNGTQYTKNTLAVDGVLNFMTQLRSKINKMGELAQSPEFKSFREMIAPLGESLSEFTGIINNLTVESNTTVSVKGGTKNIPAIDKIISMMSKLNDAVVKITSQAAAIQGAFKKRVLKGLVGDIKKFINDLNSIKIELNSVTEGKDGSTKNVANIDRVIQYINAVANLSNKIGKAAPTGTTGLTAFVGSMQIAISQLNKLTLTQSFAGFERLADAMYKLSMGAKSVVTGVDKAERALRKYSETTSHAAKATNWFVGGWRAVVNAFTGGTVIYTIVRTIREAVDAFVEFDKKLRMINTLAGMSEKALSSLGSEIVATSGKFGLNLTQAADSMFAIQSATLRGADALRVFNASAMLSVAGGADLRNSTELITRSIMAYGKHTTEAQHIADVLFKTQDRGITTIEELAHNLTKVIPSAVAARVSFEEINAAMATLTTKGLQTTVASTALNSMLLKLTSGSEKLDAVFQKLGYDSSATALKQRGLEFVMRQISAATGGAAYELQKLGFNYRDIKAAAILANDTNGFFAETLRYINDEAEEGGKALQAYKEVCKSISQQVTQLIATLKGAVVGISEFIAKWSGLKVILGLLNSFIQVKSDFNTLAGAIKMVAGPIFQVITGATLLVSSLTLLVGVFLKLKGAIAALSLAKLSASLKEVNKDSGVFAQGAKHLFDLFSTGSGSILGAIKAQIELRRATKACTEASDVFAYAQRNVSKFSAKYQEAMRNSSEATLRLKNAQNQATQASVAFKNSLKGFGKAVAWMAAITLALTALSWAWNKLSAAMDDKKAAKIRAEFSDMASEIDKLKTVTQVETRIEALSAQLEKLSTMSPTANVKALMKEYQTAIEKLNQKKMDMTNIQNAGESFEKLEEARKKLLMLDVNKMQQVNILKEENYELSKQLAMLPKASSAWAKMATKITNNTIKIRQLTNELRGMYDFVPNSLYSDVDNLYGDSLKGTSAKLKLKEDEIKTLLQQQGWSPQMISMALSQSALTTSDFRKMQGSMQDAYQVRDSLVSRVQGVLGRGLSKVTPSSYLNQVSSDLKNLGMSDLGGFDKQHLLKNIPEIVNILGKLNTDLVNFNQANLTGVDRTNEALSLSVKRLSAIVQIRERLVEGNKNATKEQREALEAAKKELQQAQELLKTKQKLVDPYMNTATSDWTRGQKKALLDLYNQDSSFKKVIDDSGLALEIKRYLSGAFDAKNMGTFVKDALKKWYTLLVPTGKVKTLKTTQADSKLIGSYQKASSANETVLRLFKEWHELQLKSNKQYAEAYRKLYASSYDVYNSLRNASFGNLAGKIGSVNRDPMDLLREKILSSTGATSDAIAAAGNTLKQFGVFNGKNLDVSNANFREAVTQAMISASSIGGEKGMQAFQQWLTAMQNLQGKMKELNDPYSKNQRKYIDAMGTPSEKMSLLKSDASKLNKLYAAEMSKKMPDASLIENLQNAIWDNAVQQKQILASIPAGKPVPVSEQVSLASKEAYHLLQAQTTSNEGQKRMYTHVGDINANFKHFIKKFDRDSRAVYTAQKQEAVNMVVAVTP